MKVYLVQLNQEWEIPKRNYQRIEELLQDTVPDEGSLLVFPEMFSTGFSMRNGGYHEDSTFLIKLAQRFGCYVMGGTVTTSEDGLKRNTSFTYSPEGKLLCEYHKQKLFRFVNENDFYEQGHLTEAFPLEEFHVAPFICYDLRFPELFRKAVARGANLMVVIASWPARRVGHWLTLLQARAIENQCFIVGVNRVGEDPHGHYPGRSIVVNPQGIIIADAGDREQILQTNLHLNEVTEWRKTFPALADLE